MFLGPMDQKRNVILDKIACYTRAKIDGLGTHTT